MAGLGNTSLPWSAVTRPVTTQRSTRSPSKSPHEKPVKGTTCLLTT